MTTLKELETRVETHVVALQQQINGVAMCEQKHWAEVQDSMMRMRQEITAYFNNTLSKPAAPKTAQPTLDTRSEPWRLPLEDFVNWKSGIEQNWEPNGNARIGQRLAKALRRTSGHAEGQLYINWCGKIGRPTVKAFWHSQGFDQVPDGL